MMRKFKLWLIVFTFLPASPCLVVGQGCSDAGFCTLNSFKPQGIDRLDEISNRFKVGLFYGGADHSIAVYGSYIEYNRILSNRASTDVKLTTLAQNGNNISVFGLSDLYLNSNINITEKAKLTAGLKIPLMNGNRTKDNLSLPMDYQSSLGTLDLIVGMGYQIGKIHLIAAFQQPLTQNSNGFIAEDYPVDSKLREFHSTSNFKRSGDLMLRASYPIEIGDKLKFTPSILPIFHINNDTYTDAQGVEIEIDGSQGLTLNGNLYFDYSVNNTNAIQLNLGMPFIVRETRPDGLTRHFIMNLEYRIKF